MSQQPSSRMFKWNNTLYINIQDVGEGGSGNVLIAQHSQTLEKVAIKIIKQKHLPHFRREIHSLRALKGHPNIIEFHKAGLGKEHGLIFMEAFGISFDNYLQLRGNLEELEARTLFRQMVEALEYCHALNICHHDVKLENFLIDPETQRVKLIDFGFSVDLANTRLFDGKILGAYAHCSPAYASKQLLFHEAHDPQLTDVFSLGICLYFMVNAKFPWCASDDELSTLKRNILINPVTIREDLNLSSSFKDLVRRLLAIEESDRITLRTILDHPWF